MPTVQIFTGFRAEKRWGGVSFFSLPESSLAHIGGGGALGWSVAKQSLRPVLFLHPRQAG